MTELIFPQIIRLGEHAYSFGIWNGERLPDRLLAFDTETELIQERQIPRLALATVYGCDGSGYFIHPDRLGDFIRQHSQAFFCCHNAAFDFWTTDQHLAADPAALAAWWAIAGEGRLCCTLLLDSLIRLGRIDAEPIPRALDVVAREYCSIELDKQDPYRLRYAELIGLPAAAWSQAEPGFFHYACKDPIATLAVMREQAAIARRLIEPYQRELLPGAQRSYGPLTACLQTQGAIALEYISRGGIAVDVERAHQLHQEIGSLVRQHMAEMEALADGAEIFKRYKRTGEYQLTPSGAAKRNAKAIKARLAQIARNADEPIHPPRVKNGSISDAASFWQDYTELDPFISAYVSFYQRANLLKFCHELKQPRIYPRYRPLVRTGRTSCSDPNLQQLPRDSRFREMIVAPPGYQLLQIDYSALELRTLAAICLRRYGRSRLAELFGAGVDPHRYTAALLLGLTLEQFDQLPKDQQKQHRQRAKAVNFGVPGGLGAASLVSYAKHSYGVQLTFEEAQQLRDRLTKEVYPELGAFLADQPWADLVVNLQCTEAQARQAFTQERQFRDAFRIVQGESATPKGDPYTPELIAHVWLTLGQLNCNLELCQALHDRQPSLELARRVFWGSAVTLTGRLRGHVGYTQRANSPFQSLAADGNKSALFRLLRAGYQVCGFVHDEMLILLPDGADYDQAVQHVQQILADAMQELTPGVPIGTEYLLGDRWYKGADQQPRDAAGRIVPYTAAAADPPASTAARSARSEPSCAPGDPPAAAVEVKPGTSTAPVEVKPQTSRPHLVQPLRWHGGKAYLAPRIIALMPAHTHYTEPYAGGLAVLMQKDPEGISEAVNDLHRGLSTFWRVLADPELFEQFYRRMEVTPLSQELFEAAADAPGSDPVQTAVQFFVRVRQSRQGLQRDYTTPTRRTRRGMNEQVSAWLSAVAGLPEIHQRLRRVEIRNLPAVDFIRQYDHPNCLHFCDPPYLHATRSTTGEYAHEMTTEQHQQLLEVLAGIQGKFLLSGYPSELYDAWAAQHDWACVQFAIDNKASSAKQKQIKTECLWMNYTPPAVDSFGTGSVSTGPDEPDQTCTQNKPNKRKPRKQQAAQTQPAAGAIN